MIDVLLSDPVALIGLISMCILLVIIGIVMGTAVFEDEPLFMLPVVLAEVTLAIYAFLNPWILVLIGFLSGVIIVVATFFSSILLGMETLLLGIPSLILFAYSLLDQQATPGLNIIEVGLFFAGIIASQLELEPASEIMGTLLPVFAFSLAIMGVVLIPVIFPQFAVITQIAELVGTIIGIAIWISYHV